MESSAGRMAKAKVGIIAELSTRFETNAYSDNA